MDLTPGGTVRRRRRRYINIIDLTLGGYDMEAVSRKALALFDKYAEGGDEAEFAGEIKLLYVTLKDRILTEEATLFRKFPGQ